MRDGKMTYRLLCPPIPLRPHEMLTRALKDGSGFAIDCVHHVLLDAETIPNVQDAIELARAGEFQYLLLNSEQAGHVNAARYFVNWERLHWRLAHPRAWTDEVEDYHKARIWTGCPANFSHSTEDGGKQYEMCVGLYREDVDGGERILDPLRDPDPIVQSANQFHHRRLVARELPGLPYRYVGARRPMVLPLPSAEHDPYMPAIFMEVYPLA